jgi:hypothetical protein
MIDIMHYDTTVYDFRKLIVKHFGEDNLFHLHAGHAYEVFDQASDQSSHIHKKFYQIYDTDDFLSLYRRFLQEQIQPVFGEPIVYQAKPTFRIHMPGNLAVGEFHKDSDYNHQRSEVTHWMPFTSAFETNTIWIESVEDLGDYEPYAVNYGEILRFPASVLRHGNKINETGLSRVSMDFRIIPLSQYSEVDAGSSHVNLKFKIGGYYSLMEV